MAFACWLVRYEKVRMVSGDRRWLLVFVGCWAAARSEQYISGLGERGGQKKCTNKF